MKQKDIAVILMVAGISAIISLTASKVLIKVPDVKTQKVEVVEPITAEFVQPDKRYFNENSVNPTQLITIGDNNNTQPFKQQ